MSFSKTSRNITVDGATLSAECQNSAGTDWPSSTLNLDTGVGNDNGSFKFRSGDFSLTAKNIKLQNPVDLLADLEQADSSNFVPASINLDDIVKNDNGVLKFVDQ